MITTINEWKKHLEKKSPDMLSPDKVKPGMIGEDYNSEKATVIQIVKAIDYKQIKKYDESGWMTQSEFDAIDIDINDPELYFIAVKDEYGDNAVFTYGYDGFVVYEDIKENKINENNSVYINSEYDGNNQKTELKYDYLLDIANISSNIDDFIKKITYGNTNSTSELDFDSIENLKKWYNDNIKTNENIKLDNLYCIVITSSGDWENPEIHFTYADNEDSAIDKILNSINMTREDIESSSDYSVTFKKIDISNIEKNNIEDDQEDINIKDDSLKPPYDDDDTYLKNRSPRDNY